MLISYCTDLGSKKQINQDSMSVLHGIYNAKEYIFAAVCDGMGGLKKGEYASSLLIKRLDEYSRNITNVLEKSKVVRQDLFYKDILSVLKNTDKEIKEYVGESTACGTTAAVVLIYEQEVFAINIGDTRIYLLNNQMKQISKDHTYVQEQVEQGKITAEEAKKSKKKHLLTQSVGAGTKLEPYFIKQVCEEGNEILLCSDGFRHKLEEVDLFERLNPEQMTAKERMEFSLKLTIEELKRKGERDNISAVLIKI